MSVRRESAVEARLLQLLREHPGRADAPRDGAEPLVDGAGLDCRTAIALFESELQSRLADLEARRLKDAGRGYYTIGSSGHEPNAVFGWLTQIDDPAFLHYRSAAFVAARARRGRAETPVFDAMLSFTASAEDPISGGRHKVLGSRSLWIPPQTSTIASHLPKAVGTAMAIARMRRLGLPLPVRDDAIVYCSFGDASANHATAQSAFNAAAAVAHQHLPCPVLFVCEDNGIGISVTTPAGWIESSFRARYGIDWFGADGRDLAATYDTARTAIEHCRRTRRPTFFRLRTVRLMGHAGTDVEAVYRSADAIEANETLDPLIAHAKALLDAGALTPAAARALYADLERRIARASHEACTRRTLRSASEVVAPLRLPDAATLRAPVAEDARRRAVFGGALPESDARPRHLAYHLAQALKDLLAAMPEMLVFGEDVARKGGVYHVTNGLFATFGAGRVFNTILDETSILGLAQGFAHLGCVPFPEIQYLAYLHNAIDQIRGEAASLQFFSEGRFANPMVVRIAGLGYQKGFGGHFHNDNSVGAILEIPGLVVAAPARADDAVRMLRACAAAARQAGKVCVFLEPIALYMTKDLHEKGDGLWQTAYPPPAEIAELGRAAVHGASDDDVLTIVSYANGLYMSLQAQRVLAAQGVRARVVDLRWLAPLPIADVRREALATGRCLVVDECRRTHAGPSATLIAELACDAALHGVRLRRLTGDDTYIPLGPAANLVMVQTEDVVRASLALVAEERRSPAEATR